MQSVTSGEELRTRGYEGWDLQGLQPGTEDPSPGSSLPPSWEPKLFVDPDPPQTPRLDPGWAP